MSSPARSSRSRLVASVAVLALASATIGSLALVGGCADAPPAAPDISGELSAIRESIEQNREPTERLALEMKRQNRRIDDLTRQVAQLNARSPAPAAGSPHGKHELGGATATTTVGPHGDASAFVDAAQPVATEVAAVLASADGRKVLEAAARGAVAESESRRRDGFVAYSLEKFAEEADLSERQRLDVREAWDGVMADARKLMRDAAPTKDMTEEQRSEAVRKIRSGMRKIGATREETMRGILDDSQFDLYMERQEEIDAGIHGAPRKARRGSDSEERQ